MRLAMLCLVGSSLLDVAPAPHTVGLRIESFTDQPVVVRVTMRVPVTRLPPDSTGRAVEPMVLHTPARLEIDAHIEQIALVTDGNRAVRLTFERGASAVERAQRVWGRELVLRRSAEGDLVSLAHAVQLLPVR
jgi:hypothetical protein